MKTIETIGIYKIENIINGKIYIGSSTRLLKRFKEHKRKLLNNTHINSILQRSWNKYGEGAFMFSVIEYCEKKDIIKIYRRI